MTNRVKIVYNICYGGFGLSDEAVVALAARKGRPLEELDLWDREDPDLVAVVEALGEKASGAGSCLAIREVPAGSLYYIREYDGAEAIVLQSEMIWTVAGGSATIQLADHQSYGSMPGA